MSWLRIDDGFMQHPKFEGWTPAQRWALLELFGYCAKYRTEGRVPVDLSLLPRGVTPRLIELAVASGWLEDREDGFHVHDWQIYNPKDPHAADRMQRRRASTPDVNSSSWRATREAVFARDNGICNDCGKDCKTLGEGRDVWCADHDPARDVLLAAGLDIYDPRYVVTRCNACHSKRTRKDASERRANGRANVRPNERPNEDPNETPNAEPNETVTRARARARGPVPSPKTNLRPSVRSELRGADEHVDPDGLTDLRDDINEQLQRARERDQADA